MPDWKNDTGVYGAGLGKRSHLCLHCRFGVCVSMSGILVCPVGTALGQFPGVPSRGTPTFVGVGAAWGGGGSGSCRLPITPRWKPR